MKNIIRAPLIFDIRCGSIDDGSGIRTVVFLKGCPLNCIWCHNPEGINPNEEILASRKIGKYYSVDELVEKIMLDSEFYKVSGGGVTFSGGEPLLHLNYLSEVMKKLKKYRLGIAVQTSGYFDYYAFKYKVQQYVDILFFDIKLMDTYLHKKYTGKGNELILDNFLAVMKEENIRVIPRVPLVPKITAIEENLLAIADFIKNAGCKEYRLLSYNEGGKAKNLNLKFKAGEEIHLRKMFEERFRGSSFLFYQLLP